MITKRKEVLSSMTAFNRESYSKKELLPEMFKLQSEMVNQIFNETHADLSTLKIYDVERHLEQLNEELQHIADKELATYKAGCKEFCNLIKAEISGNRGEAKVFRTLEFLKSQNIVLRNVELKDENNRTEIDALVITSKGLTIVEVKNTVKDIFIDEAGNYFRTGEFLKWDCNIADKMLLKESLLRRALEGTTYEGIPIKKIVVFTDSRISVQNKFPELMTCFASQLVHLIDGDKSKLIYVPEDLACIEELVKRADHNAEYIFEFDVNKFKNDFVNLLIKLELVSERDVNEESANKNNRIAFFIENLFRSRYAKNIGRTAATMGITIVASKLVDSIINHV